MIGLRAFRQSVIALMNAISCKTVSSHDAAQMSKKNTSIQLTSDCLVSWTFLLESYKDVIWFSRGLRFPQDASVHDDNWDLITRTYDQNPAIQLVCQQIVDERSDSDSTREDFEPVSMICDESD
jgi:hypothetical protein